MANTTTISLDRPLLDALDSWAKKEDRSRSSLLRVLIRQGLDDQAGEREEKDQGSKNENAD